MSRKSDADPSFFKVLSTMDFTTALRLPPAFSRKYDSHLTGNMKVRSESGRMWNLKMERMPNGSLFCLTRGWRKFAEDAALQFGEVLVFTLFTNSEFDVKIYKTNLCERGLPPPTPTPAAHGKEIIVAQSEKGSEAVTITTCPKEINSSLYFETCLKEYQKSRIIVPYEFARASGLNRRRRVRMEYVRNGCSSQVVVLHYSCYHRVALSKGWHNFREANGLEFGKFYSFHFCPYQDAILVNQLH